MGLSLAGGTGGYGFYFLMQGYGEPYTGESGIDYSDICDVVEITENGVVEKSFYAMGAGITKNFGNKSIKKDSPFTLYAGLGVSVHSKISETYYYYKWLDYPSLNEGNYYSWISERKVYPLVESYLQYDIIRTPHVRFSLIGGLNTASLLLGLISIGYCP
ncbi:MAG: hypothetical protein FD170_3375 [Bacteroidetes bacterium]|nr:MAG: hypothetical protein FD170_3375 [Bacteroidota bacterium]